MKNKIIMSNVSVRTIYTFLEDMKLKEKNINELLNRIYSSLNCIILNRKHIEDILQCCEMPEVLDK